MKKLLFILLLTPVIGIAQKSKGKAYLKIAPTVLFAKDQNAAPGILASFGPRGKYVAVGIATGYYKLPAFKNGVLPVGAELTFTEFGVSKVRPILSLGAYLPVLNSTEKTGSGSNYVNIVNKGKFQANASIGVAFPVKTKKLFFMGGYSKLRTENTTSTRSGSSTSKVVSKIGTDIYLISVGIIL